MVEMNKHGSRFVIFNQVIGDLDLGSISYLVH